MTDLQRLAREVDAARRTTPRALWPLLLPAIVLLAGAATAGDGPSCTDCRRRAHYGHACSCPTKMALKYVGPVVLSLVPGDATDVRAAIRHAGGGC